MTLQHNKFHNFEDASKIIDKVSIKTEKLDDIDFENKIDFFKIDVQGFESTIIENGVKKISDALVVQMELSPVPAYKKEKNLTYVLNLMEKLNFNLNMFHNINTRTFKPMMIAKTTGIGLHTIFQLDCVFVKNYNEIEKLDKEELKKLILIMFYSYKSYDFVDYLISLLDKISNSSLLVSLILKTISSLFDFKIFINSFARSLDDTKPCSNNLANLSITNFEFFIYFYINLLYLL